MYVKKMCINVYYVYLCTYSGLYSWLISDFGYTVCWIAIEINVSYTKEREHTSGRRQN